MPSIFLRAFFVVLSFAFANSLQAAPPQISQVSGAGPHPLGTTSVTIEISTDVLANCRLNTVDDGNPSQWTTLLNTSNNLNHTSQVTLSNNTDTARYIYCRNVSTGEVSSSFTFSITFDNSNNTPPTIDTTTGTTEVFEDSQYSYDVNATDAEDGISLDYSLVSPPGGMTIDENSGLINWTPDNDDVGNHAINIVVTDSGGLTDTENFNLSVVNVNDAPEITSTDITTANEGSAYSYTVEATDPDNGDELQFSLPIRPDGMTIGLTSGVISWTPTSAQVGSQSVEVIVTDLSGATDQRVFTITVSEANVAPVIAGPHVLNATENTEYAYDVEATDQNTSDVLLYVLDVKPPLMSINSATGLINWTPDNGDVGQHNVTITVSDGSGLSDTESFVITVSNVNGAPVFNSTPVLTATENQAYSYTAIAIDDDAGDSVTYSLDSPPAGMSIGAGSGVVTWTPSSSQVGDHNITIEATDLDGLVTPHSYVLTVNNAVADVGPVRTYISGAGPLAAGTTNTTMAISTDVVATCRYNNVDDNNPAGWTTGFSSSNGTIHTANIIIVDGEDTTRYIICKETASGIVNQIAYAFEITFETSNNQAPVFDSTFISTATVDVEYIYDVDATDPDASPGDTLTYDLLTNPPLMSIDPNSGLITWTPTISDLGDHSILIEVTDQGGLSETQPYTLTVSEVSNQAPTITAIADQTIDEDNVTSSLNFTVADAETSANSLTVTGSSDNTSLVANADIVLSGTDANRSVVVTPLANESGTANITITVSDGELTSIERFAVTVTAVNDAPTITSISNQTISEDSATGSIAFTVDDEETAAASLTVTAESDNTGLVTNANIVLSGSGTNRTVVVTPSPNQSGSATITLTVSDGESSADESFELTVNSVNDAPTITAVSDQTIDEDSATNSLSFTVGDTETLASDLTITTSSSNTTLVLTNKVVLSGSSASRSVVVTPESNESGNTTITLTVSDGQLSSSETFVVTVNSVNDLPTITSISNQSIKQNEATGSLSFTVGDVETATASLTLSGSSNNATLVPNSSIVFSGSGANRTVQVTPTSHQSGTASITATVTDGSGGIQNTSFVLTVDAPPTVDAGVDQTVDINANVTLTASASDVDGTISTYNWVQDDNDAPTIILDPNDTDVLSFIAPSVSKNTVFSFTVTVTDDSEQTASDTVEVTVLGVVPDWAKSSPITITDATPISPVIPDSDIVGALEGQASVSGGAASYAIPIALPPGRAGMQPSVSLNYSSRSGNGIAGVGWSLGVGSTIHRCGQTVAHDGKFMSVTYSVVDDRLCLDGQRLISVEGGYGQNNTVYRTEMDSFARITQLNGDLNATGTWFKLESKNGQVSYYGTDSDSKHSADGKSETLSWALKKVEDRSVKRNYVLYSYSNFGKGEDLLTSIEYTGDVDQPGNRRVIFNYVDRDEPTISFLSGGRSERTQILSSIETEYVNSKVRTYSLDYGSQSAGTGKQILRGVTECSELLGSQTCLPQTTFEWYEATTTYAEEVVSLDGEDLDWTNSIAIAMDFNGDGYKDKMIYPADNNENGILISASPNNTEQFILLTDLFDNELTFGNQIHLRMSGDIDNNGLADWVGYSNDELVVYTWENGGFVQVQTGVAFSLNQLSGLGNTFALQDMNGDGKLDFVIREQIVTGGTDWALYWYQNTSNNGSVSFNTTRKHLVDLEELIMFVSAPSYLEKDSFQDLDGNGYPDLLLRDNHKVKKIFMNYPTTNGNISIQEVSYSDLGLNDNPDDVYGQFVDLNADGLNDYIYLPSDGIWRVQLNEGDGTYGTVFNTGSDAGVFLCGDYSATGGAPCSPKYEQLMKWGDIDDDGKIELLVPGGADRIVSSYCHWESDGLNGGEPILRGCGDELYLLYRDFDQSVYYADIVEFNVGLSSITVTSTQSDIKISKSTSIVDTDADGLVDINFVYKGRYLTNGWPAGGGDWTVQRKTNHPQDLMKKVTNGLGHEYSWNYSPLSSSPDLYQPDPSFFESLAGEDFHFTSSMNVVSDVEYSSGIGTLQTESYSYRVAVYNAEGRGFQGFKTIIVDSPSGIRSVTDFHQVFPFAGKIEETRTCLTTSDELCNTGLINKTTATYFDKATANSDVHWVVPSSQEITSYDLVAGTTLSNKTTTILEADVDDYGNIFKSESIVDSGRSSGFSEVKSTTVNQYTSDANNWWFRLDNSTVTVETLTGSALHDTLLDPKKEIKTTYTYTANRQPDVVTVEPILGGGFTTSVDTDYNDYGLPTTVTTTSEAESRSINTTYSNDGETESTDGYFVYKVTNDLDHSVITKTYPEHGQVKEVIDANGLSSSTEYDAFGRIEKVTPPLGIGQPAYSRFVDCLGGCDEVTSISPTSTALNDSGVADVASLIAYKVTTTTAGAPETTLYKDKFNRVLVAKTQGFDGSPIFVRTEYDGLGRKVFESVPSFIVDEDKGTHWVRFDEQGRLLEKKLDEPTRLGTAQWFTTTYAYSDHQTSIDAVGTTKTLPTMYRTHNGIGQLMKTTDAEGGVTEYAYDAQGNPIVLQDANSNAITAKYNALGQKEYVIDPNMGRKDFTYSPFGEIDTETDALSVVTDYDYDTLGRLTSRTAGGVLEASFVYDSASQGGTTDTCVGAIQSEVRNDSGADNFNKVYSYDNYCRPSSVTTNIGSDSYTQATQYDGFYGRVKGSQTVTGITLETQYNDYGYATKSLNAASGYVYQEVTDMDARLNLTAALKANGILNEVLAYTHETGQMESVHTDTNVGGTQRHRIDYEYDDFGNLALQKVENIRNGSVILSSESYDYDDLHRLINSSQDIDGAISNIGYVYDAVGNILSKGDFGIGFVYGDMSRATNNAGPNAVVSVIKNTGGTATYAYDLNGNMTNGDGKTLTYNAFNKPLTITKGGITSTFSYAANQMRYKQVKTGLPGGAETTIYIDKAYEEITQNGVTKKRSYLGDAIVTETIGGSDAGFKIGFVHRDRLASTVTITNENGDVVDNKSFDPFGKPREGTFERVDSDSIVVPATLDFIRQLNNYEEHTNRGFTDHEHLDDSELIHMNGRVYDYNLGRFLSVDPFIQSPGNSQSMNPYSYIMNNPLAGTDPSGYAAIGTSCWLDESCGPGGTGGNDFSVDFNTGTVKHFDNGTDNSVSAYKFVLTFKIEEIGTVKDEDTGESVSTYRLISTGGTYKKREQMTTWDVVSNMIGPNIKEWGERGTEGDLDSTVLGFKLGLQKTLLGIYDAGKAMLQSGGGGGFLPQMIANEVAGDNLASLVYIPSDALGGAALSDVFVVLAPFVRGPKGVPAPNGNYYSVAFEMRLSPSSYPGTSRYMHFKEANIALEVSMNSNSLLSRLGISVPRSNSGTVIGKSPDGWVWHHNVEPGVMQLVPKSQHPSIPGGIFWQALHPNGRGGFSIWGKE